MPMSPRLLRPVASGFNPKSLSGLAAWYDASVSSSITIATGVEKWADLSGNGRDLIQTVTNNQPAYNSVTLNGKPTVTFDGTSDSLRSAAFTLNQPYALFLIFRYESSPATDSRVIDTGTPGFNRSGELYKTSTADTMALFSTGASGIGISLAAPSGQLQQFNVWDVEMNGSSSAVRYRKTVASVTGNAGTGNASRLTMAANQSATPVQFAHISVPELLMYSRVLSSSEADRVRAYLGKKYNLAYQA